MRSRKFSYSLLTFNYEGLVINFPVAHAVQTKSEDLGKFASVILCPVEPSIIFLIIPHQDDLGDHAIS
jgi:hypothetical protein